MEMEKQLTEMFTMQKALNRNILKEYKPDCITKERLQLAIIDELGELTHELKGDWCWWKKTQKPVDRQRVLEELVDVYHFVMIWEMDFLFKDRPIDTIVKFASRHFGISDTSCIISLIIHTDQKLNFLITLTHHLGFSFDEVYEEYLKKNKINYERLKNGY